jgi:hypothetical protein
MREVDRPGNAELLFIGAFGFMAAAMTSASSGALRSAALSVRFRGP